MEIKLSDAADLVGGKIIGDENLVIKNIAKIEEAESGDLTFLYLPAYEKFLSDTKASAVLIKPEFQKSNKNISYIEVQNPNAAFLKIVNSFFKPEFNLSGIDETAFIDPSAEIGENVAIGKNVVISANCKIGNNTKIYHNTVILENVEIGSDTLIFQNVSIRENCKIGNRVIIHSGTVIGSDGFGYAPNSDGSYAKIPQIGNVIIEDEAELGSNVSVDRASIGSTVIKKGAKIDNLVQIAHNVVVGEHTVISAQTGISGSTKIGSNCILAGQVGIVGHIQITDKVIIGAQSGVSKSLSKSATYMGSPAKEHRTFLVQEAHVRNIADYANKIKNLENKIDQLQKIIDEITSGKGV